MRSPLARLVAALAVLVCPLIAARALASGESRVAAQAFILREEVRAGEVVEVQWCGVEPRAEEMEVLLSLDGGRHYPIRVTPEMDPRSGRYRWRVPNLSSPEARLRIRVGRGAEESWGEPSAPFRMVGNRGAVELDLVHEGGWWTGVDECHGPAGSAALDTPERRIGCGDSTGPFETEPTTPDQPRPTGFAATRASQPLQHAAAPAPRSATPPLLVAMRI